MSIALIVTVLGGLAVLLVHQSRQASQREYLAQLRAFFGETRWMRRPDTWWRRYWRTLDTDLQRIGIRIPIRTLERGYGPLAVLFVLGATMVLHLSILLTLTVLVLCTLLPRQVVSELSARYLVRLRRALLRDVLDTGIVTLHSGTLEEACSEIEKSAVSPVIRREFRIINELGQAPGMRLVDAFVLRAEKLGVDDVTLLARLTKEAEQRNASLSALWSETRHVMALQIRTHEQIAQQNSLFRTVAMGLFVALVLFVLFGSASLHLSPLLQLGEWVTLIVFFIGVSQMAKTIRTEKLS